MLFFIINACLATNPMDCRDFPLKNESASNLEECFIEIPNLIKKWEETHLPTWKMRSLQCSLYDETKS